MALALLVLVGASLVFATETLKPAAGPRAANRTEGAAASREAVPTPEPDVAAPVIDVSRPDQGATVYSDSEPLRGRTEAGASVKVLDSSSDAEIAVTTDPDGHFSGTLPLALGTNEFVLWSRDAAGNESSALISVTRGVSLAWISLVSSATEIYPAQLPQTLRLDATVHDDAGQPVDGVEATFSLSPPNRPTTTYRTTVVNGRVSWTDVLVPDDGRSSGTWLATVLVALPSGTELRGAVSISVG